MDPVLYIAPTNDEDQSSYVTVVYGEGDDAGAETFHRGKPVDVEDKALLDAVKAVEGHEFAIGKSAVDKALKDSGDEPPAAAPASNDTPAQA